MLFDPDYVGQGRMKSKDRNYIYTGVFNKGLVKGYAIRSVKSNDNGFTDVDMTEGSWTNGKGKCKRSDGSVEEGKFVDEELVKGHITMSDGSFFDVDMVEGNWKDGKGKQTLFDGTTQEGEFKNEILIVGKKILKNLDHKIKIVIFLA